MSSYTLPEFKDYPIEDYRLGIIAGYIIGTVKTEGQCGSLGGEFVFSPPLTEKDTVTTEFFRYCFEQSDCSKGCLKGLQDYYAGITLHQCLGMQQEATPRKLPVGWRTYEG